MSHAKHQAAWRARQRAQGSRSVTIWLHPFTLARLGQIYQKTKAPAAYTLRGAIDFAFGTAKDAHWHMVRQGWENRKRR